VYVGAGVSADYAKADVKGKIALADGLAMPVKVRAGEAAGAIAQIHINDGQLHEMMVSTIWGSPTLDNVCEWSRSPVVSVRNGDGDELKKLLQRGPVQVRMRTRVETGWRRIPLLTADIPGVEELSQFVLVSGHVDSWYHGAMDNGTANAGMLELARILNANRTSTSSPWARRVPRFLPNPSVWSRLMRSRPMLSRKSQVRNSTASDRPGQEINRSGG
jgi:hypothetical protein